MNVLILGSEGFVGCNLVEELSNHNVIRADQISLVQQNYKKFDITNPNELATIINKDTDIVIDLVAHSLVSSIDDTVKNAQINIIGLLNVLDACRKNDIKKIIFTSASSLIGQPQKLHVSENHPAIPKTAYGITKLTSEHYLRLYKELYGLDYVVFRFFNIYGQHQKNGLIPTLYNKLSHGEPIQVFGTGNQIRDYVFIKDISYFFNKAIVENIANNSIFNLGTGTGTSIMDVITNMSNIMQVTPKIEFKPERKGEIGNFVADTTLLNSVFGIIPQTKLVDGLQKTIDWIKTKNNNVN